MNFVENSYLTKTGAVIAWFENVGPTNARAEDLETYPEGPVFIASDPNEVLRFLHKCAEDETERHFEDNEMDSVVLTIDFEFGTMAKKRMEMAFTFWKEGQEGSISFCLSCIKDETGQISVFGDAEFSQDDQS